MGPERTIPISWYFDDTIAQSEMDFLFKNNPSYIGHKLLVPNTNDYYVLEREQQGKILINQGNRYSLLSNICRHHEALMLTHRGNTQKIICPVHKWSYNTNGELLNAPRFEQKPCLNLPKHELNEFHGLLFLSNDPLKMKLEKEISEAIDSAKYEFHQLVVQQNPFNWKIFMEVYLDNYHIPAIHPGLSRLVDITRQRWIIDSHYSAQFVKLQTNLEHYGSKNYELYQKIIMDHYNTRSPDLDIMWFAIYPNVTIERYPFALIISSTEPVSINESCTYVEFYLEKEIMKKYPDFANIFMAAYSETAVEDEKIGESIHKGRYLIHKEKNYHPGPHHPLMEQGLPSFYNFLYSNLT